MIYDLEHGAVALLVIDVQREYFKPGGPAEVVGAPTILSSVNLLIDGFRAAGKPVIFIRHANRADGSDAGRMGDFSGADEDDSFIEGTEEVEFVPGLHHREGDMVVVKRRYSAFAGTELEQLLRTAQVRSIVVTGLMTSFCCESTARDGHDRDYEVIFVSDANEGPDLESPDGDVVDHSRVLESTIVALSAGFAEVIPAAEVLARVG